MSQLHVAKPHIHQGAQTVSSLGNGGEHIRRLFHRHLQHIGDGVPLVGDLQRLPIEASALADVALHVDVRQEVHLDHIHALATAGLTPTTLDVEAELPHLITTGLGLHRCGEHLTDRIEGSGVRGGVGAGGPPDR